MYEPNMQEILQDPEKLKTIIMSAAYVAGMFATAAFVGLRKSLQEQRVQREALESEVNRTINELQDKYEVLASRVTLARAVSNPKILGKQEDHLRLALEEQAYCDQIQHYQHQADKLAGKLLFYPSLWKVHKALTRFDNSLQDLYRTIPALQYSAGQSQAP